MRDDRFGGSTGGPSTLFCTLFVLDATGDVLADVIGVVAWLPKKTKKQIYDTKCDFKKSTIYGLCCWIFSGFLHFLEFFDKLKKETVIQDSKFW